MCWMRRLAHFHTRSLWACAAVARPDAPLPRSSPSATRLSLSVHSCAARYTTRATRPRFSLRISALMQLGAVADLLVWSRRGSCSTKAPQSLFHGASCSHSARSRHLTWPAASGPSSC
jgi:hypothetical protein